MQQSLGDRATPRATENPVLRSHNKRLFFTKNKHSLFSRARRVARSRVQARTNNTHHPRLNLPEPAWIHAHSRIETGSPGPCSRPSLIAEAGGELRLSASYSAGLSTVPGQFSLLVLLILPPFVPRPFTPVWQVSFAETRFPGVFLS